MASHLKHSLTYAGLEDVFLSGQNGYAVDTKLIDCDFYRFLEGDVHARGLYTGEYMSQFSWAEATNSWLESELKNAKK